jgi:hypothetical protein
MTPESPPLCASATRWGGSWCSLSTNPRSYIDNSLVFFLTWLQLMLCQIPSQRGTKQPVAVLLRFSPTYCWFHDPCSDTSHPLLVQGHVCCLPGTSCSSRVRLDNSQGFPWQWSTSWDSREAQASSPTCPPALNVLSFRASRLFVTLIVRVTFPGSDTLPYSQPRSPHREGVSHQHAHLSCLHIHQSSPHLLLLSEASRTIIISKTSTAQVRHP